MDSMITAAARALAAGDPLGALKRVALRDDAPALALRGIAMAQLGELPRAKALLRRAARAFGRTLPSGHWPASEKRDVAGRAVRKACAPRCRLRPSCDWIGKRRVGWLV